MKFIKIILYGRSFLHKFILNTKSIGVNRNDKKIQLKRYTNIFYVRSLLLKINLTTASIGLNRNDNKESKIKFIKIFSMKDRFYIKLV